MKTVCLVRHAKSSWADPSLADDERPLNKRGLRDAPVMGQRLADQQIKIDAIWSSPALRAMETARCLAKALEIPRKAIERHARMYSGSIDDLLLEIKSCPDKVKTLLIVGHNPLIAEFANFLINGCHPSEIDHIPTCGIVALQFKYSSWQDIKKNEGQLLFFDYPKKKVDLA